MYLPESETFNSLKTHRTGPQLFVKDIFQSIVCKIPYPWCGGDTFDESRGEHHTHAGVIDDTHLRICYTVLIHTDTRSFRNEYREFNLKVYCKYTVFDIRKKTKKNW